MGMGIHAYLGYTRHGHMVAWLHGVGLGSSKICTGTMDQDNMTPNSFKEDIAVTNYPPFHTMFCPSHKHGSEK